MNCLEFRRRFESEPGLRDPALDRHHRECRGCASFTTRVLRFDRRLQAAMRVDVPEGLASRVLLRQSFKARSTRPWWRRHHAYAIAAALLLSIGAATMNSQPQSDGTELGREVVAMATMATYALAPTARVSEQQINAVLRPVGLAISGKVGRVTFAGRCKIKGRKAGHLVIRGTHAPIVVFLMPHQRVARVEVVHGSELDALLLPAPGGAIAVVGHPGRGIEQVASQVRAAVSWPTA